MKPIKTKQELKKVITDRLAYNDRMLDMANDEAEANMLRGENRLAQFILTHYLQKQDETENKDYVFKECKTIYTSFIMTKKKMIPDFNKIECIKLREIIAYLKKNVEYNMRLSDPQNVDEQVVGIFQRIFEIWQTFPPRIQNWTTLYQINSNKGQILAAMIEMKNKHNGQNKDIDAIIATFKFAGND